MVLGQGGPGCGAGPRYLRHLMGPAVGLAALQQLGRQIAVLPIELLEDKRPAFGAGALAGAQSGRGGWSWLVPAWAPHRHCFALLACGGCPVNTAPPYRLVQRRVGPPISSELPEVSRLVYQVWGSRSCSSWNPSEDDSVGVLGTTHLPAQHTSWCWRASGLVCQAVLGSGQVCDPRCKWDPAQPHELKTEANSRNEGCFPFGNKSLLHVPVLGGSFLLSINYSWPRMHRLCPKSPGQLPQLWSTGTSVLGCPPVLPRCQACLRGLPDPLNSSLNFLGRELQVSPHKTPWQLSWGPEGCGHRTASPAQPRRVRHAPWRSR